MGRYVVGLEELDRTRVAVAGGKGANLGELTRIDGITVPLGFCVTTEAFQRVVADAPAMAEPLDRLSRLEPDDGEAIRAASADVRRAIEGIAVPDDLASAVTAAIVELGGDAYAVRSSATAEDLPTASFAGQHDSYLNVEGPAVLEHVRRCWASLFTERAVSYRLRAGIDHSQVRMAVVVQRLVRARASGVLFTADPVTGDRTVTSVEATVGLGEALVSGRVDPDVYEVRDGAIVSRRVAAKAVAVHASPAGGTEERAIEPERQERPALTDAQVCELARVGRRIEAHLGHPQDIEWCLTDGGVEIVQSRPITTLFPVPEPADDEDLHVYISVGHQQMMTDPMTPLGLSVWQATTPRPMAEAGGRLFVDVTRLLASPTVGPGFVADFRRSDPLIADALQTILDRGVLAAPSGEEPAVPPGSVTPGEPPAPLAADPAIVEGLIARTQASIAATARRIQGLSGPALLEFIVDDFQELRRILFDPQSHQAIMAGMEATWWLNDHLHEWLGERDAADALARSAPHNITSQMGLALLDVADVIRPHPEVVAFLRDVEDDDFLDALPAVAGGREARDAIRSYLDTYGMRCVGEIDITRPRWSERPAALVPIVLSHVDGFEPGAGADRFEQGRQESARHAEAVLARVRALPDGEAKAAETAEMIERVRTFIGYREYPKYGMVHRYFVYKQALMAEAERLAEAGVLHDAEDVFFLRLEELREVVRTGVADHALIRERRDAFRSYQALTPPRVLTSDGEAVAGAYRREDVPAGALVGLPVSAGTVEGRARVLRDMAQADLVAGDILVTAYTDPSWTPAFVTVAALVTEVGGLMTHGAVIAREYGLPAVVGVQDATRVIQDGQRIRVHGAGGYVEILD